MKLLPWCLLLVCVTLYLLMGGLIFMAFEHSGNESSHNDDGEIQPCRPCPKQVVSPCDQNLVNFIEEMSSTLESQLPPPDGRPLDTRRRDLLEEFRVKIQNAMHNVGNGELKVASLVTPEGAVNLNWDYYNSVVYAFTIITTVGYGHLTPKTEFSRIFAVFYGLIGIPLHMLLVGAMGSYFSQKFTHLGRPKNKHRMLLYAYGGSKLRLILQIIYYLIPGFMAFIVLPAGLFVAVENWTFAESFYFAGISLMTIGFGDYVPGIVNANGRFWLWMYKIFVFVWIEVGLGYVVMIFGFATRALRHKNLLRLIQRKLLHSLDIEDTDTIDHRNEKLLEHVQLLQTVMATGHPSSESVRIKPNPFVFETDSELENCCKVGNVYHVQSKDGGTRLFEISAVEEEEETSEEARGEQDTFLLPNELLAAIVNVLRHSVLHQVLEALDKENNGGGGNDSKENCEDLHHQSVSEKTKRKILENKRDSLFYLKTLTAKSAASEVDDGWWGKGSEKKSNELDKNPNYSQGLRKHEKVVGGKDFDGAFQKFSSAIFRPTRSTSTTDAQNPGNHHKHRSKRKYSTYFNKIAKNQFVASTSSSPRDLNDGTNPQKCTTCPAERSQSTTRTPVPVHRSSRRGHMSLTLDANIVHEFSQMLEALHNTLKPPRANYDAHAPQPSTFESTV